MSAMLRLLELIRSKEAPNGYDELYSNAERLEAEPLTSMTAGEVIELQSRMLHAGYASTAAGAYQFLQRTLRDLYRGGHFRLGDRFKPRLQDDLAIALMRRRGLDRFLAGEISSIKFGNELAKEWASLPVLSGAKRGRSYYSGDGLNKQFHSVETVIMRLDALKAAGFNPTELDGAQAAAGGISTLRLGSSGYRVKALQERLIELGYHPGAVDRSYGRLTRAAVREFQDDNGLEPDGEAGEKTLAALDQAKPKTLSASRSDATMTDLRAKGSRGVAAGDLAQAAGVLAPAAAVVNEARKADPLQAASEIANKAASAKGLAETFADLWAWGLAHWPLFVIIVAGYLAFRAGMIGKLARLGDHRSGANLGR